MAAHARSARHVAPVAAIIVAAVLAAPRSLSGQGGPSGAVYRIPITGTIELGLAPFVARSLREAEREGARAAVLDLDTPGGRIDAAQQIADAVRDARIPVYAFVDRRALSAGAMVALAADSIFMRPGSVIGAATPVSGQGQKLPEKYVSAMRAEFRALAEERGIDPRIAEGMVDEDVEVPGVKPRGQLLTLATSEAIRLGVARAEVADFDGLLSAVGIRGATNVVTTQPNWAEALVRFASHPMVAPILLSLGVLGLVIELKTPHFGLAGLFGLVCLTLFFGSHWIVGLAGWGELILIGLGLVGILVEIFVVPGFGVAGLLGIGALGTGFVLSMLGRFPTTADIGQAVGGIAVGVLIVVAVLIAFLRHLPASKRLAGILHLESAPSAAGFISAPARSDLVGKTGTAVSELRPVGVAEIGGERVDVTTEGEFLPAGTPVTVVRAEDMRVVVRPVAQYTR